MGMKHTNFPCVICWNRRKTALLVKTRGAAPLPAGSRLSHTGIASGFPTGGSSPSACRSMVISIIHQTGRSSNCLSESYTKKTRFLTSCRRVLLDGRTCVRFYAYHVNCSVFSEQKEITALATKLSGYFFNRL